MDDITAKIAASLKYRHRRERRLKLYGIASILFGLGFLLILLTNIALNAAPALQQGKILLAFEIAPETLLDDNGRVSQDKVFDTNWDGLIRKALMTELGDLAKGMRARREAGKMISDNAGFALSDHMAGRPELLGRPLQVWLNTSDDVDRYLKGQVNTSLPQDERRLTDQQIAWIDALVERGSIERTFNWQFLTSADSREPEDAGILGAVMGSAMVLFVTIILALPLAVMAAIYLEYFAKPGRLTDFIEVNINNLAAVPSIVFGLLGLAVFLNFLHLPRSAPLVGGMVLALMTLPTIIIAARSAIRAVPPSIREAALGLGASNMQAAIDHVLPMAMPGILTGTIIGMAQALGETAPLLMIGMVAFITEVPTSITEPATALPVQIFIWSDSAERAFYEKASLAILFLVGFLILINLSAVLLRRRLERIR